MRSARFVESAGAGDADATRARQQGRIRRDARGEICTAKCNENEIAHGHAMHRVEAVSKRGQARNGQANAIEARVTARTIAKNPTHVTGAARLTSLLEGAGIGDGCDPAVDAFERAIASDSRHDRQALRGCKHPKQEATGRG